uniref:Uncharacterized protein n=1 Tax=Glossina austeni TaxID=7395 RepID=A0A1A9VL91_GLOAU
MPVPSHLKQKRSNFDIMNQKYVMIKNNMFKKIMYNNQKRNYPPTLIIEPKRSLLVAIHFICFCLLSMPTIETIKHHLGRESIFEDISTACLSRGQSQRLISTLDGILTMSNEDSSHNPCTTPLRQRQTTVVKNVNLLLQQEISGWRRNPGAKGALEP